MQGIHFISFLMCVSLQDINSKRTWITFPAHTLCSRVWNQTRLFGVQIESQGAQLQHYRGQRQSTQGAQRNICVIGAQLYVQKGVQLENHNGIPFPTKSLSYWNLPCLMLPTHRPRLQTCATSASQPWAPNPSTLIAQCWVRPFT